MSLIDHPAHYGGDGVYEHVKVAEALDWNYAIGSATKYIWRAGRKHGVKATEDLRKAVWWLEYEIERLEARSKR